MLSTNECFAIVDKMIEEKVMRVVMCGGGPLMRGDILLIYDPS